MRKMHSRTQSIRVGPAARSVLAAFHLRRGFTLIELLVVIAIISAVTIATVPMILPALDVRRIREASRIVSTHFASAQSEAIAKGRPVGVWIERLSGTPTAAMDLFTCEVPPPYAGDGNGTAIVTKTGNVFSFQIMQAPPNQSQPDSSEYGLAAKMIHGGDLIRFNYRGLYYRVSSDASKNDLENDSTGQPTIVKLSNNTRTSPNPGIVFEVPVGAVTPPVGQNLPFQIMRQPIKSAGSPVQLPAGAAIDLFSSGMTSVGYAGTVGSGPLLVLFNKSGAVDSVYSNGAKQDVTGPLYFLIGKRSKVPPPAYSWQNDTQPTQGEKHNFRDLENIWVSINPQTGLVTTAEAAEFTDSFDSAAGIDPVTDTNTLQMQGKSQAQIDAYILGKAIGASRRFATSAQSMGGR